MSNKFQLWVEDNNLSGNVQAYSSFANDNQRKNGFHPGDPASSIRMNTILRQASLINCAIMNALDPNDDSTDYLSSLSTLNGIVKSGLNKQKVLVGHANSVSALYTLLNNLITNSETDGSYTKTNVPLMIHITSTRTTMSNFTDGYTCVFKNNVYPTVNLSVSVWDTHSSIDMYAGISFSDNIFTFGNFHLNNGVIYKEVKGSYPDSVSGGVTFIGYTCEMSFENFSADVYYVGVNQNLNSDL